MYNVYILYHTLQSCMIHKRFNKNKDYFTCK